MVLSASPVSAGICLSRPPQALQTAVRFGATPSPPPAPAPSSPEASAAAAAVKPTATNAPAGAAAPAAVPADTLEYREQPAERKPNGFKEFVRWGARMALNSFILGASLFILVGAPLLHIPMVTGIISIMGVQLLQNWVHRRFGHHADVTNPQKMRQIADKTIGYMDKAIAMGNNVLKKIPVIKYTSGIFNFFATRTRNLIAKGLRAVAENVIPNMVSLGALPADWNRRGFFGKAMYLAKVVLQQTLQMVTGPFGKAGKWIYDGCSWLFKLQDAKDFVDAFAGNRKPAPLDTPPAMPPGAAAPDATATVSASAGGSPPAAGAGTAAQGQAVPEASPPPPQAKGRRKPRGKRNA